MSEESGAESGQKKRPKRHLVEIDKELYKRIGVIASWQDVSIPDWVNNALKPLIDNAFPVAVKDMGGPGTDEQPKKK